MFLQAPSACGIGRRSQTPPSNFPPRKKNKNVGLIGAKNGFGKTSLLEAPHPRTLWPRRHGGFFRAVADSNGDARHVPTTNTRNAHFTLRPLIKARNSITIEVVLEEGDESLRIQRRWHFTGDGRHRRNEEDIQVFTGPDEEPMAPPWVQAITRRSRRFFPRPHRPAISSMGLGRALPVRW